MAAFLDVCRFTPTLGGTTDWTYSSAVQGYQSPTAAGAVNGTIYRYRAESADLSQWEIGFGAYNSGTGVFARTTVLFNSLGTTAKISFTSAPQVAIVAIKEDLISIEEANSFTAAQQAQARINIEAAPFDALAYNNLLINGGMEVDQEHAGGATTVAGLYAVDGWLAGKSGTMVCTIQQVADAPPGFTNSLKVTVGTAEASIAAGDAVYIYQKIEGFRTSRLAFGGANALTMTLGFWTKIHRTGTYSGEIANGANTRSYPFTFTQNVADTWEYKTVTIPGDTAGTWIGNTNGVGLEVVFAVATGTTFTAAAGAWATGNFLGANGTTNGVAAVTDVFQITGVCLLPGTEAPSAARSPLIKRSVDQELLLCQRYLFRHGPFSSGIGPIQGGSYNSSLFLGALIAPVIMRAAPTFTRSADADWNVVGGGTSAAAVSMTTNGAPSVRGCLVQTGNTLTAGSAYVLQNANTSAWLQLDARL